MRNLIDYVPPIIAFVAMFVGLLGPSRHTDKTGLGSITPFGWISFAIAATSLGVAVYLQHLKDRDLAIALASQQQMRAVVTRELSQDVESLRNVLRYAALMPYVTSAVTSPDLSKDIPYAKYKTSHRATDIDLRSDEVIYVLERLYLSPEARMNAPMIPSAVPFGTQVAKTCLTVIVDESRGAAARIESAIQKYAAIALTPEVISAGSELTTSPFLKHLTGLRESWANRAEMEDSNSPRSLNFRFLNSGLSGGDTKQYLEFIDRLNRLSAMLVTTQQ